MLRQSCALSTGSHILAPVMMPALLMGMVLGLSVIALEAKAVSFVTNCDALNATDYVNWSTLGPLFSPLGPPDPTAFVPNSFTTTSQAANSVQVDIPKVDIPGLLTRFVFETAPEPEIATNFKNKSSTLDYSTLFKEIAIPAWKRHPSSGKANCPVVNTWPHSSGHFNTLITTDSYRNAFPNNVLDSTYMGDSRHKIPNTSGFFQIKQHQGKFTFVDPLGYPFYSLGVNSVRPTQDGAVTISALNKKYKGQSKKEKILNWGADATSFLKSYGFNTMGSW